MSQPLQLAIDLLSLTLAWYFTGQLRVWLNPYMSKEFSYEKAMSVAPPLWVVLCLWMATTVRLNPYRDHPHRTILASIWQAIESALVVMTTAIVATFFSQEFGAPVSRSFILLLAPVSLVFLIAARSMKGLIWGAAAARWQGPLGLAVLGEGREARALIERIDRENLPSVKAAGIILPDESGVEAEYASSVLGSASQLAELINREQLHHIIVLSGSVSDREIAQCEQVCKRMGVVMNRAVGPVTTSEFELTLTTRFGMQVIELKPVAFTRRQELIKRACDVFGSFILLILFLPLLIVVALLIKTTSEGPILYRSRRVGRGGRYFMFLKFRSMYTKESRQQVARMNEHSGHLFKIKNDPRITPVGRFLRRYSLDELPQLINVLRGDMSLLGPRPLPAEDLGPDGMSRLFAVWAEQRSRVLPGITGLWQIRGRSDLTFEQMMQLDIDYIRRWSLWLDLKILLATPRAVISGRGAY